MSKFNIIEIKNMIWHVVNILDEIKIIENYNAGVSEIVSLMKEMNSELTNHINSLTIELN